MVKAFQLRPLREQNHLGIFTGAVLPMLTYFKPKLTNVDHDVFYISAVTYRGYLIPENFLSYISIWIGLIEVIL